MQFTNQDFCGMDNKMKENNSNNVDDEEETELDDNHNNKDQSYNPNWTLRKCSSKLFDCMSVLYPEIIIQQVKPIFEIDLQSQLWYVKEKAILSLGACAGGCYDILKPHMPCLLNFLIKELQNSNKFIRAITCWTLSR